MIRVPRPPRTPFGSIRLKVFLLYTFILFITFSLFSGSVYLYSWHEVYQKVDALLEVRAIGLEDSIRTYLKTSSPQLPTGWAKLFFKSEPVEEDRFSDIAGFLTENILSVNDNQIRIFMDIFDAEGSLIASSNTPPPLAALKPDILKSVRRGERKFYTYTVPAKDGANIKARAMMQPIFEKGQLVYFIQTRTSLQAIQTQLVSAARVLVVLAIITLFVASWAGILLVKVTLTPVDHMVRRIRNIGPSDLSVRLDLPDANDEIRALANTFNEMLAHVEKSFIAQKKVMQDLSHELKTPLTVMRGQLGVALKKPRLPSEYQALLSSNLEEIAKMRRLIDDLLMIARFDSRVAELDFIKVNLKGLIQSVLDDIEVLTKDRSITVVLSGPEDTSVAGNEIHLRRLFSNLLDNAVKYTPKGGAIHVSLSLEEMGVWVMIQDTGIGIRADQLPHIFDRFYRADNERRSDSHGLGLSIVKSIVDAHKGEIRIDSKLGEGTTFRIFLHKNLPTALF